MSFFVMRKRGKVNGRGCFLSPTSRATHTISEERNRHYLSLAIVPEAIANSIKMHWSMKHPLSVWFMNYPSVNITYNYKTKRPRYLTRSRSGLHSKCAQLSAILTTIATYCLNPATVVCLFNAHTINKTRLYANWAFLASKRREQTAVNAFQLFQPEVIFIKFNTPRARSSLTFRPLFRNDNLFVTYQSAPWKSAVLSGDSSS